MKKALLLLLFLGALPTFAQSPARFDLPVVTTTAAQVPPGTLPNLLAVANATISVCQYPAVMSNGMCTNTITTYTDSTLATACPSTAQLTAPGTSVCISTTGLQGAFGFWYNAATQTHMTYTISTSWGNFGPYDILQGGESGGGSGTVTNFSSQASVAPLFSTSVSNATTTPALSFTLGSFGAHTFYGNNTGSTATPGADLIGASDWSPNDYAIGSGSAQAQSVTLTPAPPTLAAGLEVRWLPIAANTGAGATLNVNGLGAVTITKTGISALAADDLTTTAIADAIYDGTYWQLLNPQTSSGGGGSCPEGTCIVNAPSAAQTITLNTSGANTLTLANPNAGSSATAGYSASNGTDFFDLEIAGTGTASPGAVAFVMSNATAPLDFQTAGGPIIFNAPNTNISGALNYAADTGAANAYVAAPPGCVSAILGTTINFEAANASTGASTLVYCIGSPVTLYKNGSTSLTTGDILAGAQYSARYDGTNWQLLNSSAGGSGSLPTATAAGQAPLSTGAGTTYAANQVEPQGFGYTFFIDSSGNTNARNNQTGAVDYSNVDAGVVINDAINNISSTCGHLYFEPGIYNINSLIAETTSGYTNYYAIGIPAQAGTTQYCQWFIEGDSAPDLRDEFSDPVQTSGVVFYVTPTAVATVGSSVMIDDIWVRPGASGTVSSSLWMKNFDLRFPSNQRGNETGADVTQAANANYENVIADTDVAEASLAFPVAGSIGMYGLTSTNSIHEENYIKSSYAVGYDTSFDIESEHTVLINSFGLHTNYCANYGVRGTNDIYHASTWVGGGCGEFIHGLTLGANVTQGTLLDWTGFDMEEVASGTWGPVVYHAKETNTGYSFGHITYSRYLSGSESAIVAGLFDGGGGTGFTTQNQNQTIVQSVAVSQASGIAYPTMGIADNEPSTTSGNFPFDIYVPNLANGGYSEQRLMHNAPGSGATVGNGALWGFWNVGSANNCNQIFFGVYGSSYPLTAAYNGDVGIGVGLGTCPVAKLEVDGTSKFTGQITSSLATGSAPFSIASTTVVPNLNVSQLLGSTWAVPGAIGSTTPNTGAFTSINGVTLVASTTTTVGTTAIAANTCTSATTVTMTGVATTSTFTFTPSSDVSGVTGWGSSGGLLIDAWPTANTLNYKVCNQTAASITPSASVTFNVSAR